MKYKAIIETDDFEDFEFFEDKNGKYLHAVDANATNGEWIYLPFKALEQESKPMVEIDLYSVIKQKYIERDVLDKIRAEIKSKLDNINRLYNQDNQYDDGAIDSLQYALDIIDKYRESEE